MAKSTVGRRWAAFTLIELLVVIAIIALLVSILLPALAQARRAARLSVCTANMQQTGRAQFAYGTDFRDFIGAFNGLPKHMVNDHGLGLHGILGLIFCNEQATHILSLYGKYAGPFDYGQAEDVHVITEEHSHLLLVDYMGDKLPMPSSACPEDRPRLDWQRKPEDIDKSPFKPVRSTNTSITKWYPYSSSYQLLAAGWLANKAPPPQLAQLGPFKQAELHNHYGYNKGETIGKRKFADVVFPAQKVAVADTQQRHFGKDLYYAFPEAKQPLLFWDGSVRVKQTGEANKGWNRLRPSDMQDATKFTYAADPSYESLPPNSPTIYTAKITAAYYKWTRGGLAGIDYGGGEIDTSKW